MVARDPRLRVSGRIVTSAAGRLLVSYLIGAIIVTVIASLGGGVLGIDFNPVVLVLVALAGAVLLWFLAVIEDWAPPKHWDDIRFPSSSLHVGSDNRTRRPRRSSSDPTHRMGSAPCGTAHQLTVAACAFARRDGAPVVTPAQPRLWLPRAPTTVPSLRRTCRPTRGDQPPMTTSIPRGGGQPRVRGPRLRRAARTPEPYAGARWGLAARADRGPPPGQDRAREPRWRWDAVHVPVHADLLPERLTGATYDQRQRARVRRARSRAVLADDQPTPPKTQSALLEAM